MEAFIITLVAIIGVAFVIEIYLAKPDIGEMAAGFIPSIPNSAALYIAIGIIGATVMPHNLYLHSALVQTRRFGKDEKSLRNAIKFNFIDSAVALNLAFFCQRSHSHRCSCDIFQKWLARSSGNSGCICIP